MQNRVLRTREIFWATDHVECNVLSCDWLQEKDIREVKHDVYGKRQTAKIELLVFDFSRLYNLGKLFTFTVIKGFFSYFSTGFI